MSDLNSSDGRRISRRRLLEEFGATAGFGGLGVATGGGDSGRTLSGLSGLSGDCPEATIEPDRIHYDDSIHEVCSDAHPESRAIQDAVRTSLEEQYPTVGSLIDSDYIPYFDFFADGSWSHWINPAFIGDDTMVDPERPGSILVDHTWWRPIGVMFVATVAGERQDPPPPVYGDGDADHRACVPWHAHVGLPGRYAWWKYRTVYERPSAEFPCRTPWLMHVWNYAHAESIYAHSAPEARGGPPAEDPGFDTDADPDEAELGPEHLPDALEHRARSLWQRSVRERETSSDSLLRW
jgi:hypothetical protein